MMHFFFLLIILFVHCAQALEYSGSFDYQQLSSDNDELDTSTYSTAAQKAQGIFASCGEKICARAVIKHQLWLPEMFNIFDQSECFREGSYKEMGMQNVASYVGILLHQSHRDAIVEHLYNHPLSSQKITARIVSLLLPSKHIIREHSSSDSTEKIELISERQSTARKPSLKNKSYNSRLKKIEALLGNSPSHSQEDIREAFADVQCDMEIFRAIIEEKKYSCPDMFNILEKKRTTKKKPVCQRVIMSIARTARRMLPQAAITSISQYLEENPLTMQECSNKIQTILAQAPVKKCSMKKRKCSPDITEQKTKVQNITERYSASSTPEYEDNISAELMKAYK